LTSNPIAEPEPLTGVGQRDVRRAARHLAGGIGPEWVRLGITMLAIAAGFVAARFTRLADFSHSSAYLYIASSLLAVGLYGSTYTISLTEARRSIRTVVAAVTLGVLGKSLLTSALTFLIFRKPVFLVLAVAVSQIDPLSVAATGRSSSMSIRAQSILAAWASFDDPVTVLITIYAATFAVTSPRGKAGLIFTMRGHDGIVGYLVGVGGNLAFAAGVVAACVVARAISRRDQLGFRQVSRPVMGAAKARGSARTPNLGVSAVTVVLLVGLFAMAIWQFLMLGLALIGLVYRPKAIAPLLERAVVIAFVLVAIALGMFLANGIDVEYGIVLGLAAFGAQVCASLPLTRTLPASDRVQLAIAQQNGVTAILLALLLEPAFPQATAIMGPAILTINVSHLFSRALWDRRSTIAPIVRFGLPCIHPRRLP
jgi:hypothetical protein